MLAMTFKSVWCPREESKGGALPAVSVRASLDYLIRKFISIIIFNQSLRLSLEVLSSKTKKKHLSYDKHFFLVPERGVEPPRPYDHTLLKRACLPFQHSGNYQILLSKNLLPKPVFKYFSLSIAFSLLLHAS